MKFVVIDASNASVSFYSSPLFGKSAEACLDMILDKEGRSVNDVEWIAAEEIKINGVI